MSLATLPQYGDYKDSGMAWLGKIPSNWQLKALKHIADLQSGETIKPEHFSQEGFPVYGGNGFRGYTSKFTNEGHHILIGRQGALCGNVNYASGRFYASEHAIVVYPKDKTEVIWLGEIIRTANLNRYSQSAAQPGIAVTTIKDIYFPFPPIKEQTAIARFLDKKTTQIDEAIAIKQQQIELLKERKKIIIQQAVTRGLDPDVPMKDSGVEWIGEIPAHWNVKKLKHLFFEVNERTTTGEEKLLSLRMDKGLVPHNDVSDKHIPSENLIDYKLVKSGQLVMNRMRAAIGIFGIPMIDGLVSPDYAVFNIDEEAEPSFYLLIFKTSLMGSQFRLSSKGMGTGSSGFMRLYTDAFGSIKVPSPPHVEQKKLVEEIHAISEKIDGAIEVQREQIERLREYKTTLINSAVTGKIKVPQVTE